MESARHEARPAPFVWWRAALLVPLVWWTVRLAGGWTAWCPLDLVNLAFHEAGHLVFSFGGTTLHILGGTLGQLLVPFGLGVSFLLVHGRPSGAAFCLWWTGESLVNVAVYMADARELALPLVGGGEHDWNELLFRWGLLGEPAVARVAVTTHLLGSLVMLAGLVWCGAFALGPQGRRELVSRVEAVAPRLAPLFDDEQGAG